MFLPIGHFQVNVQVTGKTLIFLLYEDQYTFEIDTNGSYFDWVQIEGEPLAINDPTLKNPTIDRPLQVRGPFLFEVTINRRATAQFEIVTSPISEASPFTVGADAQPYYETEWTPQSIRYALNGENQAFEVLDGTSLDFYFSPPLRHSDRVTRYEVYQRQSDGTFTLDTTIIPPNDKIWTSEVGRHYRIRTFLNLSGRNFYVDSSPFYTGVRDLDKSEWVTNSKRGFTAGAIAGEPLVWNRNNYRVQQQIPQDDPVGVTIGASGYQGDITWNRNVYNVAIRTESEPKPLAMTIGAVGGEPLTWNRTNYYSTLI